MYVSSRSAQVKRKSHKSDWRDKLDDAGLRYLEGRRSRQKAIAKVRKEPVVNVVEEIVSKMEAISSRQTDYQKKFSELKAADPSVARAASEVESQIREIFLMDVPPVVEIWNFISDLLEQMGPGGRKGVAFLLAITTHVSWSVFQDVRRRHFGDAKLTTRESLWVFGTALANVGKVYRTGDPAPITKGRASPELTDVVKAIRKHEKRRLSYRELKDAIEYTGIHCSDENSLRLFVHRARKRGWLI